MIIPMQVQGRSDKDGLNPGCLSRVGHKNRSTLLGFIIKSFRLKLPCLGPG